MTEFNAQRARGKRPCPIWVDAFQRDTQHLGADEVGAYFLILMAMWTREDCDLPDDDVRLAKVCRVSLRLWKARIGPILRPFFTVFDGAIRSKKLRIEAAAVEAFLQGQSDRKSGPDKKSDPYAKPQGNNESSSANDENSDKPLKNNEPPLTVDMSGEGPTIHPTQHPNISKKEDAYASLVKVPETQFCVDHFNALAEAVGWPKVQKLTAPRKAALGGRIRDVGSEAAWCEAITRASNSPFLTGQNGSHWRADFDWLCKPANFTKLMEGNYDPRSPQHRDRPGAAGMVDAFAEVARRAANGN